MKVESVAIKSLTMDPENARTHSEKNIKAIAGSLTTFGQRKPLVVWDNIVIAGNGTIEAAKSLGWEKIEITRVPSDWSHDQARAFALADNRTAELAEWDNDILANQLIDLDSVGYEINDWGFEPLTPPSDPIRADEGIDLQDEMDIAVGQRESINLAATYGVPPFSILDQRSGHWQERKRLWMALGIQSEVGRGENLLGFSDTIRQPDQEKRAQENKSEGEALASSGTSIFDPVLTELMVSWFSPPDGLILDPFAGGSVRGVVAASLGRKYTGIELRDEQVQANKVQALEILPKTKGSGTCEWITGDSNIVLPTLDLQADMILSCPPYFDLEIYSDDPADISNMTYENFLETYRSIIKHSVNLLKDDRFIVWVIGDVRDSKGIYRGFVPDTIQAFQDAGASYYNEGILVSPIGSLALRLNRQFQAGRKFGKAHQNVLVFVKGDGKKATQACGDVVIPNLLEEEE